MSIRKEDAFQHALCMDLQKDGLNYAVISKSSKKIVAQKSVPIEQYDREAITPLLEDELLTYDYGAFAATAGGNRNTLMPVELFNHSKAEEIFKLNYRAPIDNLDYNRIPELGIVNIYEIPLWIKSMMVIKFPRVKLIHPVTVLLKGVFNQPTWSPKLHIYLNEDSFYLLITAKSKLAYFNRFDHTNLEDLIYHVTFVMEQKEMDQNKVEIHLYGVPESWEGLNELQKYFKNPIKLDKVKEKSEHFVLANQLLCV